MGMFSSRNRARTSVLAVVWVVVAIVLLTAPFAFNSSTLNLLVLTGINLMVAVGLSLLFGFAGQISLAQAQLMGLGAYTSAILATKLHTPFLVSFLLAGLVPAALAYLIGRPILRLRGYYLAMATVAIGGILAVLFEQLTSLTGGFNGIVGIMPPSIGSFSFNTPNSYYYLVLVVAVLAVLFSWNVTRSRVGRAMRALREAETGASVMGVNVPATKAMVFAFGAGLAGLAGSLYAHYTQFVSPETFTISQSVTFILILSIGGLGTLGGAVTGAILLTLLPQWLRSFGQYDNLIYGLVVIFVIMFLPVGVWGGLRAIAVWIFDRVTGGKKDTPDAVVPSEAPVPSQVGGTL